MSEPYTKWDKFIHWFNTGTVPLNYVTVVVGGVGIGLSLLFGHYDLWLAASIIIVAWSVWDILKWRRIKREHRQQTVAQRPTSIGPDDDPDFLRTI